MKTETGMDYLAFLLWFIGISLICYSLGFIPTLGLFLLFASDNIVACRRLEKNGITNWWKYE